MVKYRLKKDLPFAKAGTEVYDGRYGYITVKNLITKDGGSFFIGYDIKELLTEGWIEEVKPREWTLLKANNGQIVNASEGFDQFNFKGSLAGIVERIKVREVIE